MRTQCTIELILATVLIGLHVGSVDGGTDTTTIPLDSRATYLHTNNDNVPDCAIIQLAALDLFPGDQIRIEQLGGFDNGLGRDIPRAMIGVFSASSELLGWAESHRVPGAIDAGVDIESAPTYVGDQQTDIPEDFRITNPAGNQQICIVIPDGATHLFCAGHDSYYSDNSDPNGDYAVRITLLGCVTDCGGAPSGATDVGDLLALLAQWGETGSCDVDCDEVVGVGDLLALLSAWGPCD